MTAIQMNAEVLRQLSLIAEDETLMKKVLAYVKKLTAQKPDPTLMTREEFFARIDRASKGNSMTFASVDELDRHIRSL